MEIIDLIGQSREGGGSRVAGRLRRQGEIPAVLYGHGMKPLSLKVNGRDLRKALHTKAGENVVINLKIEGIKLKESTCRVREIQHHPTTEAINHVDFTIFSLTERIEVKVPLVVKNADQAVGVKEGGILDVIHHEIEIECLPTQIPEKIELDIKAMKIGDTLHVSDLKLAEGIKVKFEPEEALVSLHPPVKEEAAPVTEETPTQPEVIEKGKKEETPAEEKK